VVVTLAVPSDGTGGSSAGPDAIDLDDGLDRSDAEAAVARVEEWLPIGLRPAIAAGAAVVVGLVAIGLWRRRRTDEGETTVAADDHDGAADGETATDTGETNASGDLAPGEAARDRLEAGDPDAAVELAYLDLRSQLLEKLAIDGARTHWEFLEGCRSDGLDEDRLAALETVTETYEDAAFAPDPVEPDRASRAIDLAVEDVDRG
jgi:hypothetical protein